MWRNQPSQRAMCVCSRVGGHWSAVALHLNFCWCFAGRDEILILPAPVQCIVQLKSLVFAYRWLHEGNLNIQHWGNVSHHIKINHWDESRMSFPDFWIMSQTILFCCNLRDRIDVSWGSFDEWGAVRKFPGVTPDKIDYFAFRHCCYIFNHVVFHLQALKNNANWPNFIL